MNSDYPDFRTLIDLKKEFDAHILLDIPRDFGCLGPRGKGLLVETASYANIEYVIGSFSKTFASIGGFLAATNCLPAKRAVQEYSGSYTFSNFPIPSQLGAINAAMDIVFSEAGEWLRRKLLSNTLQLGESLARKGSPRSRGS